MAMIVRLVIAVLLLSLPRVSSSQDYSKDQGSLVGLQAKTLQNSLKIKSWSGSVTETRTRGKNRVMVHQASIDFEFDAEMKYCFFTKKMHTDIDGKLLPKGSQFVAFESVFDTNHEFKFVARSTLGDVVPRIIRSDLDFAKHEQINFSEFHPRGLQRVGEKDPLDLINFLLENMRELNLKVSSETVHQIPCIYIEQLNDQGYGDQYWFSKEHGLPVRRKNSGPNQRMGWEIQYEELDGVWLPTVRKLITHNKTFLFHETWKVVNQSINQPIRKRNSDCLLKNQRMTLHDESTAMDFNVASPTVLGRKQVVSKQTPKTDSSWNWAWIAAIGIFAGVFFASIAKGKPSELKV